MRIHHNISSLNTVNTLQRNRFNANKSLEKLSSGYKNNRASDDAAGLAISEKMRGQIRGLNMSSKNIQDGMSLVQTAEGALNEIHSIVNRIRELAVQSANDTNTNQDRQALNLEVNQLLEEIDSIADKAEFNTKKLLNGTDSSSNTTTSTSTSGIILGNGDIHKAEDGWFYFGNIGAKVKVNSGEEIKHDAANSLFTNLAIMMSFDDTNILTMTVIDKDAVKTIHNLPMTTSFSYNGVTIDISEVTMRAPSGQINHILAGNFQLAEGKNDSTTGGNSQSNLIKLQVGANSNQNIELTLPDMRTSKLGISSLDITTQSASNHAITLADKAISIVSDERSKLGAIQNRLEHAYNVNMNTSENLQSAESVIRDADIAQEMMKFTKDNILMQAAQSMLAQSNQQSQMVLQLIQ